MRLRKPFRMTELVIDPEDVTLLATIAENPQMPDVEFQRCLDGLTPKSRAIAKAIRAIATNGPRPLKLTAAYQAALGMLEWAKQNRIERKSAFVA